MMRRSTWPEVEIEQLRAKGESTLVGGPFGSDLTQSDYVTEPGVPVIRGTNLGGKESRFVDDGFVYVTTEKATKLRRNMAFPGDVIFTQRGTLGQIAIIPKDARFPEYLISQSQMKLTPDGSKIDARFLYQYFRTPAALRRLLGQTQATGVPHINLGILKRFAVPVPPLDEQRRIAEVLDRAETLRAKRRAALAQLDTLTQSIFLDLFGDPVTNLKRWPMLMLRDVLAIPLRNGLSPSTTGSVSARVLTLSAVTGDRFNLEATKTSTFESTPPQAQSVHADDLLICRGNGNLRLVGKAYFPSQSMPDVTFPDTIIAARIDPHKINRLFLQHVWNSSSVRRQIESLARTTNGTFKVNQTILEGIAFPSPPSDLQQDFANRVASVENLKTIQRRSLAELDALFASLQHRAFRGEL